MLAVLFGRVAASRARRGGPEGATPAARHAALVGARPNADVLHDNVLYSKTYYPSVPVGTRR